MKLGIRHFYRIKVLLRLLRIHLRVELDFQITILCF